MGEIILQKIMKLGKIRFGIREDVLLEGTRDQFCIAIGMVSTLLSSFTEYLSI